MTLNNSNLDTSIHLADACAHGNQKTEGDALGSSFSSDVYPLRPVYRSQGTSSRSLDKHKYQSYGRPDDWVGPAPAGSRRMVTKSWRRKEPALDAGTCNSFQTAQRMCQTKERETSTTNVDDAGRRNNHTPLDSSLHESFNFQDLVVVTANQELPDTTGIDESQHSVLTEDSKSKFTNLMKMWNNSTSLGRSIVQEGDEEEEASFSSESPFEDALSSLVSQERKGGVEGPSNATSSFHKPEAKRWSSNCNEKKSTVPELEDSFASSTAASDSITWKGIGTMERGLRPAESLTPRSKASQYQRTCSNRSLFSTNDSVISSSSISSSQHGHHGHNRPDVWVGGQSKPSQRSWRPKSSTSVSRSSNCDEKKSNVPELEDSFASSTAASDSITWKGIGTKERGLRPAENFPLSPKASQYQRTCSNRSVFSTNDSVISSSSISSSQHGHHGHNRPDVWVGGQSNPSQRSWRPKSTSVSSK
ncbi:hypothetical protein IV203_031671 [Nitzschia inconspicua]|uniref:Uncharacterized protein n=1 Tax=Nitzschia inconspicua TaxID=303405 RepID=A0A9K3LVP7_9STRA|nr:hypothetical protein IV203_031671 [Nitzschia inconspicua]